MRQIENERAIEDVALFAEPVRRRLYEFVAGAGRDVGRDEAAKAVDVDRALAAFHLDKLVDAGFLGTTFRRLSGASGPGAGRPSKLYRKTEKVAAASVPARQYESLARLFAEAVREAHSPAVERELAAAASRMGQALGDEARRAAGPRPSEARLVRAAESTLARHGFAPRRVSPHELRLGNCPFDALARDYRSIVCAMNEDLMTAFVRGLGTRGIRAALDPREGTCCVALRSKSS
jgi:predicted ArsR family transcriptional regulator